MKTLYLAALAYVAAAGYAIWRGPVVSETGFHTGTEFSLGGDGSWFSTMKAHCNTLEVEIAMQRNPPPETLEGKGFGAACWALAGRIDKARGLIDELTNGDRYKAAGIVFEIAHPIADMGDDRSAGPIMSMVVDYWPNHYMALYHAGAANYAIGKRDLARTQLNDFLVYYKQDDGWTRNARTMLGDLEQ